MQNTPLSHAKGEGAASTGTARLVSQMRRVPATSANAFPGRKTHQSTSSCRMVVVQRFAAELRSGNHNSRTGFAFCRRGGLCLGRFTPCRHQPLLLILGLVLGPGRFRTRCQLQPVLLVLVQALYLITATFWVEPSLHHPSRGDTPRRGQTLPVLLHARARRVVPPATIRWMSHHRDNGDRCRPKWKTTTSATLAELMLPARGSPACAILCAH